MPQRIILVISQVYVPDPASVGQHMADAAAELVRRGYRVIVYASDRGYDDPACRYPRRESIDGVAVRRIPLSHFGKRRILWRLFGAMLFLLQVIVRAMFLRRLDGILVSTSPPIAPLAALVISVARRVPITYWAMDINPDQAITLGHTRPGSLPVRLFNVLNRAILRRARRVVALDRYMAARLQAKYPLGDRLVVMPPWPHESSLAPVAHEDNPFRQRHALQGKFVFMYSGNMSRAHPLDTFLDATLRLQHRPEAVFLFIGGGLAKQHVEEFIAQHRPANVRLLPYQPLEELRYSLSAADVHLVSMGNAMVGIVHPCKLYGAMACARPSLLVGPRESHLGELIDRYRMGWQVDQGDVAGLVALIERILAGDKAELAAMGGRARAAIDSELGQRMLCGRFCDEVEKTTARI